MRLLTILASRVTHLVRAWFNPPREEVPILGLVQRVWKGNHSRCPRWHWSGVCHATNAWSLPPDGTPKPIVVGMPVSEERTGKSLRPVHVVPRWRSEWILPNGSAVEAWRGKGFRHYFETIGTRPSAEGAAALQDRAKQEAAALARFSRSKGA